MKKKIGTVMEADVLTEAKTRAAREGRSLADVIQDALTQYLHEDAYRGDALRACEKFCSHGSTLARAEIEEILQEDLLTV